MLLLLFIPIFYVVACAHRYLQVYAPSNVVVARVRAAPPRLRTAGWLMLLAAILIAAMHQLAEAVAAGAPGWLNIVVLVLAWDSIKFGLAAAVMATQCLGSVRPVGGDGVGVPGPRGKRPPCPHLKVKVRDSGAARTQAKGARRRRLDERAQLDV